MAKFKVGDIVRVLPPEPLLDPGDWGADLVTYFINGLKAMYSDGEYEITAVTEMCGETVYRLHPNPAHLLWAESALEKA